MGAVLTILCGLLVWGTRLGDRLEEVSYDYLFLHARTPSNNVELVFMDEATYRAFNQTRAKSWDRRHHADLLNKLTDDGCRMVVLDMFFEHTNDANADTALAEAIRRQGQVILAARAIEERRSGFSSIQAGLAPFFLNAARGWGYGDAGVPELETPRWEPFDALPDLPSLPRVAAALSGAHAKATDQKRWLRYYGEDHGLKRCSYGSVLSQPPGYFRDKIVFVGSEPERKNNPDYPEKDKFHTPSTRWTGESAGGVEILATEFENLVNGDWLQRPPWWMEILVLALAGGFLGAGLGRIRLWLAWGIGIATM